MTIFRSELCFECLQGKILESLTYPEGAQDKDSLYTNVLLYTGTEIVPVALKGYSTGHMQQGPYSGAREHSSTEAK